MMTALEELRNAINNLNHQDMPLQSIKGGLNELLDEAEASNVNGGSSPVPQTVVAIAAGPDWLSTLNQSNGADPPDVWDLTNSSLTVLALSGTDIGKSAIIGPNTSTPHPITDYAAPMGSHPAPSDTKRAGDLNVTVSYVSNHWRVYMPSEGNYAAILEPYVDFFYP